MAGVESEEKVMVLAEKLSEENLDRKELTTVVLAVPGPPTSNDACKANISPVSKENSVVLVGHLCQEAPDTRYNRAGKPAEHMGISGSLSVKAYMER